MYLDEALRTRLSNEFQVLKKENIPMKPVDLNPLLWIGIIRYRGRKFPRKDYGFFVEIPKQYPYKPPNIRFTTPISHPNIFKDWVCLNVLRDSWKPSYTLVTVYNSLVWLLDHPNYFG